jgi:hypothetical protein
MHLLEERSEQEQTKFINHLRNEMERILPMPYTGGE